MADETTTLVTSRPPITHVALRFRGQVWSLPKPYRHHHVIRMIIWMSDHYGEQNVSHVDAHGDDQGFLDASGRYLNRRQAHVSADINGQIIEGRGKLRELYSEDVW